MSGSGSRAQRINATLTIACYYQTLSTDVVVGAAMPAAPMTPPGSHGLRESINAIANAATRCITELETAARTGCVAASNMRGTLSCRRSVARWGRRTRVGHGDLVGLIGVQPDLPQPAAQHGGCEPLLQLQAHHGCQVLRDPGSLQEASLGRVAPYKQARVQMARVQGLSSKFNRMHYSCLGVIVYVIAPV